MGVVTLLASIRFSPGPQKGPSGAYLPEPLATYEEKFKHLSDLTQDSPRRGVNHPELGTDMLHFVSRAKSPSGGNPPGYAVPAIAPSPAETKVKSPSVRPESYPPQRANHPAPISDILSHETRASSTSASTQNNQPFGEGHAKTASAPSPQACDTKANSTQVNLQDATNQPGPSSDSSYPETQTDLPSVDIPEKPKEDQLTAHSSAPPLQARNTSNITAEGRL